MNILRRSLFAAAIATGFTLATPVAGSAAGMESTSIALPAVTITFLPVYVAEDKGMWKNLGLNVTLHDITGMGATNAMLAGSVDFTVQSGESLIRGNIRGRPMLGVELMADGIAFELVARKPSLNGLDLSAPLAKRMAAFKGKKVSVDAPNTVVDALLRFFAAKAGLNAKTDMTEVYMQPTEAIAALKSGSIDAAMLNFPWIETAQREAGAVVLASGLTDVPELVPTVATPTTTRAEFCNTHESICAKLVHGYVLAQQFIHEHPNEALQVAVKRMPQADLSDLQKSMPYILQTTPKVPRFDEVGFAHAQQIMITGGMMQKDEARKSFAGMFTNKYVDMFVKPNM